MSANVQFVLDGDEQKAVESFLNVVRAQKKSENQAKRTDKAINKQQRTMQRVEQGAGRLGKAFIGALGTGGAAGAITGAIQLMRTLNEEAKRTAESVEQAIPSRRTLAQVAASPEDLQRLTSRAQSFRQQAGVGQQQAQQTLFQAASAGRRFTTPKAINTLATLQQIGFDPQKGIESTQKLQAAFGKDQAGNFRSVLNQILAAAGPSPVAAQDIAKASASASASFKAIGGRPSSLLGAGAVLSEQFKSPEESFQRIKTLSDQLFKKRARIQGADDLQGLELIRALPRLAEEGRLRSAGGEKQRLTKFLGEAGALQAIEALTNRSDKVQQRITSIRQARGEAGTEDAPIRQALRTILSDPKASATAGKQQAEQRSKVAKENRLATGRLLLQNFRQARDAALRRQGSSEAFIQLSQFAEVPLDLINQGRGIFTGDTAARTRLRELFEQRSLPGQRNFVGAEGFEKQGPGPPLAERVERFLERNEETQQAQQRAAEKMERAAEKMNREGDRPAATQPSNQTE